MWGLWWMRMPKASWRNLVTGKSVPRGRWPWCREGGDRNVFFLSTTAKGCTRHGHWRAYKKGASSLTPVTRRLIQRWPFPVRGEHSIDAHADVRIVRKRRRVWANGKEAGSSPPASTTAAGPRLLSRTQIFPASKLGPEDISSPTAKEDVDSGRGVGPGESVYYARFCGRDQNDCARVGFESVRELSNVRKITARRCEAPMRIYPAVHYTMGGTWVDDI